MKILQVVLVTLALFFSLVIIIMGLSRPTSHDFPLYPSGQYQYVYSDNDQTYVLVCPPSDAISRELIQKYHLHQENTPFGSTTNVDMEAEYDELAYIFSTDALWVRIGYQEMDQDDFINLCLDMMEKREASFLPPSVIYMRLSQAGFIKETPIYPIKEGSEELEEQGSTFLIHNIIVDYWRS